MSRTEWSMTKLCVLVTTALVLCLVLGAAPVGAAGTIRVDGDAAGCVGTSGQGNPYGVVYCKIQDAVTDAKPGDTVHVYPRTGPYNESVNLSGMDPDRDLTLIAVNASGVPTPGTVTVHYSGIEAELYTNPALNGDLTIDGFVVHSAYPGIEVEVDGGPGADRNVVIRNVTATETADDGIRVSADGNVTISNCVANNNDQNGIHIAGVGGVAVVTDCTANGNGEYGILVDVIGPVAAEAGLAAGAAGDKVTITNCTANDNEEDGFFVAGAASDSVQAANANGENVTIANCTAIGNGESGFDPVSILGQLTIQGCLMQDNEYGVDLDEMFMASGVLVNGNIICGNDCGIVNPVSQLNAEGNWWGCPGGPVAEGCDHICQEGSIAVDFTPWIDTITGSASVDPATVGQPTLVTFQFRGGPPAVYLGEGPGDLRGPAPFTVSTDNGTLNGNGATVEEFINAANGTLKVTLVPNTAGTATVTVSGPCGLADLEGATAVLGVVAAQEEFVPEPGTVLLLGSGLMGLAGYAALRLRSGQGLRLRKR